jgi:hypothetical protein
VAVTHPRKAVQVQLLPDALTARSSIGVRTPAPQAGGMGSIPIRATDWPSGGTGRHATLRTSSRNRRGSSTLPLVTAEWTGVWFPARSHMPFDAGSNPASATWRPSTQNWQSGQVESLVIVCGFDSHLGYYDGLVVQRRRVLAHIQTTMVRVHPGSLEQLGCWSKRTTPAPHAGNEGATPSRSTAGGRKAVIRQPWKLETVGSSPTPLTCGLMVQRDDTSSADWKSGFDSRWVL